MTHAPHGHATTQSPITPSPHDPITVALPVTVPDRARVGPHRGQSQRAADAASGLGAGRRAVFVRRPAVVQPGDRVLLHTHPVEEALTFLSGEGEATLGEETVPIGAGVSLYIPAGVVHGFRCTAGTLHVLVVFPVPEFAETAIIEDAAD